MVIWTMVRLTNYLQNSVTKCWMCIYKFHLIKGLEREEYGAGTRPAIKHWGQEGRAMSRGSVQNTYTGQGSLKINYSSLAGPRREIPFTCFPDINSNVTLKVPKLFYSFQVWSQ